MARERVYRTEAVILRRGDFGEADRMLTLLTPNGKQRVLAKGARKTTSRLAGHIELFTHTTVLLAVGRNFDILTQSATLHTYDQLRSDLQRISGAYYLTELADRLIEEQDENRLSFELLVETLAALDVHRCRSIMVLRYFELHLLGHIGYRPRLYHCANCQDALTEDASRFSPTLGGMLCPRCAAADRAALPVSLHAFKLLRFLQTHLIEEIERLTISEPVRREAELLLRAYIRPVLERDLKSVAFLGRSSHRPA